MDLETIIIGGLSLALFVVPFLYLQRRLHANKKKLLQEFTSLAQQRQLNITQHDFWDPNYAIGIDTDEKKVLYVRKRDDKEQILVLNLLDLKQCRVNNLYRDSEGGRTIDIVELSLVFANAKIPEKALEFYNREVNLNFSDELLLAKKWENIINANLAPADTSVSYAVQGGR